MRNVILGILVLGLMGCAGTKQYLPIIDATLIGVRGVTEATRDNAVAQDDLVVCYVTASLITALDSSKDVVDSWAQGNKKGVIPAVTVDLAACHAMVEGGVKPVIDSAKVKAKVDNVVKTFGPMFFTVLDAIVASVDVNCRDRAVAQAVLRYVRGAVEPVIEVMADPAKTLEVPEVTLDLSSCDVDNLEPVQMPVMACEPCQCSEAPASE